KADAREGRSAVGDAADGPGRVVAGHAHHQDAIQAGTHGVGPREAAGRLRGCAARALDRDGRVTGARTEHQRERHYGDRRPDSPPFPHVHHRRLLHPPGQHRAGHQIPVSARHIGCLGTVLGRGGPAGPAGHRAGGRPAACNSLESFDFLAGRQGAGTAHGPFPHPARERAPSRTPGRAITKPGWRRAPRGWMGADRSSPRRDARKPPAHAARIAAMRTVQPCRLGVASRMAGVVRVSPAAAASRSSRPARASPCADVTSPRLSEGCPRPPLVGAVRSHVPDAAAHREVGTWHRSWTRHPPIRRATCRAWHRRAIVALSKLSRLGRVKYALALLTALATSGAVRAHAASSCVIGYPFKSSDPRTDVSFNQSDVLRALSPQQIVNATPGLSIKVWYNDEHALTLGVRRVIVQTKTGTTTTDYPVSALSTNPGSVLNPQVGTTALDGDQAGTDTSACSGYPDLCDRPMFPALFITDITTNPTSTAGDWQHGGTPIPPHAVFGTWKGAVRPVNKTRSPALITVLPDANPARNYWNLGSGDPAPLGLTNQGWGAEVRWNVDDLVAAGKMILGHAYRLQFMVHDGDQTGTGGDSGENCVNLKPNCADATACDDRNPCTADYCVLGS